MDTSSAPYWAALALLAVLIAAPGFVGKTAADLILRLQETARDSKSRLTELYHFCGPVMWRLRFSRRTRCLYPAFTKHTTRFGCCHRHRESLENGSHPSS